MVFLQLDSNLKEKEFGAKATNLSFMLNNGLPIPFGYVLGNEAFKKKDEILNDFSAFKESIETISTKLASSFVMVRSSAVGEDSEGLSFAGQLDSFITKNDPNEIYHSILKCWESIENTRQRQYGESLGMNLCSMGVIVQEMIEPDYAGVLFTHSPNNFNEGLIEWVEGHCEKLVSGEVSPETRSFTHNNIEIDTPFNFKELYKLSEKILKLYKKPQDIEWAIKDNIVYIVQSRPITNLKSKINWSNTNVNENYPDKLSPFLYSLARNSYYHYFKNLTIKLGVYPQDSVFHENQFSSIIGMWGHRMYYNMSSIHGVLGLTPFEGLFKKSFDDFVGYQKETSPSLKLTNNIKKVKFSLLLLNNFFKLENRVKAIEKGVDEFYEYSYKASSHLELSRAYHQFLNIRFNEWNKASFADLFAMFTHGILGKVCHVLNPLKAQGIQNELLQAIPNLISNKPIFEMYSMYEVVYQSRELQLLFKEDAKTIWSELQIKDDLLYRKIKKYLNEWGFRCSGELTFLSDNYLDNPLAFIEMLKIYVTSTPQEPDNLFLKKRNEQKLLLKSICSDAIKSKRILKIISGLVLPTIVRLTSYSISCRERVRLKQAKLYYGAKLTLGKFSKNLIKKNILKLDKDIYFLEYQEISRLFSGEEVDKEYISSLIEIRKNSFDKSEQKTDNFISHLEDFDNEIIFIEKEISEGDLIGLPACGGEIKGQVKVLESMHEIHKLRQGDILVTRQTDPGWICAFPMISGLIVERGGMLSHGAIVAREFGIPAIVGVEKVTSLLKDGQTVHINAYTGVIKCLD